MSIHLFIFRLFCCSRLPKVIFLLSFLIGLKANATHIFGGHLKLTQIDPEAGRFKVSLLVYIDMTDVDLIEEEYYVSRVYEIPMYSKKSNTEVARFKIDFKSFKPVTYENPACAALLKLNTREYLYENEITINLNDFTEIEGYYMAFDYCCRNGAISNIQKPKDNGIVFYTEFPALLVDDLPVSFSTPTFPILNGDYICINRNFTFDFGAIDPDKDELRYSLVWPSRGNSDISRSVPTVSGPYPLVAWSAGISLSTIIPGTVPLKINPKTGMLSVNASMLGIYVFSVQVDKIRNGVKIGSVRHDFQLPVVDCSPTTPPVPIITLNASPIKEVAICPGDKIVLATDTNPRWAFQWQKNGDNITKANTNQLTINSIGKYDVVKSFNDQCVNDTVSAVVEVVYKKGIDANISRPSPTCINDSMLLSVVTASQNSFEWYYKQKLIAKDRRIYAKNGGYYVLKENPLTAICDVPLDSILVGFEALPVPVVSNEPILKCLRDTVNLESKGPNDWTYQWFKHKNLLGNQTASVIAVRDTGTYYVQVSNAIGCKNLSKGIKVGLKSDCLQTDGRLFIPDIFTPNADGINDTWQIRNLDLNSESIVTIFNRWGEVVYYSDNYSASPWDGRYNGQIVSTGVYAYTIQFPKSKYTMRGQLMVAY